jgi:hypothetical protein
MYGFKKLKFEFPIIKRAQVDFWSIEFCRCVHVPTESEINPQPRRNIVVAWTLKFEHMFGIFWSPAVFWYEAIFKK